ncbi:MAG: amino acid ABC transporter permease [Chloroflexota bacterium]
MILVSLSAYSYDWSVVPRSMPVLAQGLLFTLQISILSLTFSLILGLGVALCRLSPFKPLSFLAFGYIQIFRALSLYVYILLLYFGLAAVIGIKLNPLGASVTSLTLLNAAYMAEIYRAAIGGVDHGQWEAATSLGLSQIGSFFAVVLPQAFRIAVPSLMNQLVDIIKDSSIVAVIAASDLMYNTIQLNGFYNRPFELYFTTGLIYLAVVAIVSQLAVGFERRLKRHLA